MRDATATTMSKLVKSTPMVWVLATAPPFHDTQPLPICQLNAIQVFFGFGFLESAYGDRRRRTDLPHNRPCSANRSREALAIQRSGSGSPRIGVPRPRSRRANRKFAPTARRLCFVRGMSKPRDHRPLGLLSPFQPHRCAFPQIDSHFQYIHGSEASIPMTNNASYPFS